MNHIRIPLTVLALFVFTHSLLSAQAGPALPQHPEPPELVLGMSESPILVYKDVPTRWMVDVLNVHSPCTKEGTVKVASEDCFIQTSKAGRFQFEVPGSKGSIAIYLELEDRVIAVEKLLFETIEADTNNADFRSAHPNGAWKKHLSSYETAEFGKKPVVEDPNFVLDMPGPVLQSIQAKEANRIHANFIGDCVALKPLQMEAKGASIEKLPGWNNFNIVPEKGAKEVELRVWSKNQGKKQSLTKVVVPVQQAQ